MTAKPHDGKQPIIVLGTARSGTSWCANILAMHPAIAAVASAEYEGLTGIHESHLFSHTRYCFPDIVDTVEFVDRYKQEDYFKLTGLSPDEFCRRHPGRHSVSRLFRLIMEDYAEEQGASHWLEKTPKHTIYFRELARDFPDALFVVTRRGFRDTILSNINKYPRKGSTFPRQVAEKVFRWVSDRRAIQRFKRSLRGRFIEVSYESMLRDPSTEIARVLGFLNLEQRDLHSTFPSNSAYGSSKPAPRRISGLAWPAVYLAAAIYWLTPYPLVRSLRLRRDRRSARRFPKYTFVPTPDKWSRA